jgi:DNA-binding transcriptional MerR regulator
VAQQEAAGRARDALRAASFGASTRVHARPDDPEGFGGPQVCQLVGITYRQLDHWARTGLLRPSLAEAQGSGTKRRYSYRDVLELKVIKRLIDGGVSLQSARRAVGCLREDLGADLASANLVLSDTRSVLAHTDGELVDLLARGQCVFNVVPLSGVVDELAADVVAIGRGGGPLRRDGRTAAPAGQASHAQAAGE